MVTNPKYGVCPILVKEILKKQRNIFPSGWEGEGISRPANISGSNQHRSMEAGSSNERELERS